MQGEAEGVGDGLHGAVVVGRADAPGGEDVAVGGEAGLHGRTDGLRLISHHPHLAEADAERAELGGEVREVDVLRAP